VPFSRALECGSILGFQVGAYQAEVGKAALTYLACVQTHQAHGVGIISVIEHLVNAVTIPTTLTTNRKTWRKTRISTRMRTRRRITPMTTTCPGRCA
jgi:hypothetical protein